MADRRPSRSNSPAGRRPGGPGGFVSPIPGRVQIRPWRPRNVANDNRAPVKLRLARVMFALAILALVGLTIWVS